MKTPIKIIASLLLGLLWYWVLSLLGYYISMIASQVIGFIVFFACILFISLKPLQKKLESSSYGTIASVVCSGLSASLFLFLYNRAEVGWFCGTALIIITGACFYLVAGKFDKK